MKRRFLKMCMVIAFSTLGVATAGANISCELPYSIPGAYIKPLYDSVDQDLQKRIQRIVYQNPFWKTLIRNKKMSLAVVEIGNPQKARFAQINGNVMMYAASLPKIAILLASMQAIADGNLTETPEVVKDLTNMIRRSDNRSATRMIDRLGFKQINDILTDPRYGLYDHSRGGGLWVGKRYASTGQRLPDPIKGLSHAATATQACRFYYLLSMGKLVDRNRSRQMLELLSEPAIEHKFVYVLHQRVPDAVLFRKSGTWRQWHSDSVLVWGPEWRRYIVVALVENRSGEKILRNLIAELDTCLKEVSFTGLQAP